MSGEGLWLGLDASRARGEPEAEAGAEWQQQAAERAEALRDGRGSKYVSKSVRQ